MMVEPDEALVEARLVAGELDCTDCGGELRPWGHARPRLLRDHGRWVELQPRRSICQTCSKARGKLKTHVLLPTLVLLRRMDVAAVIGEALIAIHRDRSTRKEVARVAGAPVDTVRGWRRRFGKRVDQIREFFTTLAHRWDPELGAIATRATVALDALEAIGVAVAAAVRRFGAQPQWQLVAAATGGRLLCNTSCPLPAMS